MKKLIVLVLIVLNLQVFAQEKKYSFTLQEAITFALDSNYTTLNARRDIAKAIKQKWEVTSQGLPQINGKITYQNNLKQPVSLIPAEFFGGEPGTFAPVEFSPKQSVNASATLSQLIFDGSYLVGLQAAKVFLTFSENASEKTKLEVRKGVINAYGSVLLAQEMVTILEKNKKTLEQNLFETQKIYENGFTEEESVEQLQITLLDITNRLKNAQEMLGIAKKMFNLALGIDVDAAVKFTDSLKDLAIKNTSLQLINAPLDLENNIDYKIASNLTQQRQLELKREKSTALPNLAAFINLGTLANNNDFSFLQNNQKWYAFAVFGATMNIPLFSSLGRHAKTQRAKIALDQANTQLKETEQKIKLEQAQAQANYRFAIENYQNASKNLNLAERIEHKNQIKFKEGLASSFELRQAQVQLYSAQQNYYQAMLQVINSKAALETVLNKIN